MLMRMPVQIEPRSAAPASRVRRRRPSAHPCALAVGGLDPGGGAGVLADLRAFERAGAFGCAAVTLTTVQSVAGLRSIHVEPAKRLVAEITEVLDHQFVRAIKVGALGSVANVRALSKELKRRPTIPVIVDTPMQATRGRARLIDPGALSAVMGLLLPLATLVTVNVDEARAFIGLPVRSLNDARLAARSMADRNIRAVLVKGGHLRGRLATDVLLIDGEIIEIRAPRLPGRSVHGTGCALASLVAGRIACVTQGLPDRHVLLAAVRWAKRVHHAALSRAFPIGRGLFVMRP
jgi:hydroxymethylpyrimidine/phosphomethylpyrimidine kinase